MAEDGATAVPRIVVLMATHQGARYIDEQLRTVLGQQGVEVRLVISDDASTDGTAAIVASAAHDPRVTVLPARRSGSAPGNFLRLVREADVADADAVAFVDQDDLWHLDKLSRQWALLGSRGADAVSSDVLAFWGPDPEHATAARMLRKSQPQRELDFLLESAGPGCTFLMSARAFATIREVVADPARIDPSVPHDWLAYAIVRATGGSWYIDDESTLDYRQHGKNTTGANVGLRQAAVRGGKLANGEYRRQCGAVARLSAELAEGALGARLAAVAPLFDRSDLASRRALWRIAPQLRRDPRDVVLLRLVLLLGTW
ncbi:rhamnosyltransferase [Agrococcus baldri]|uniref:Rhamnosyltransferase n=1 Tax=Agrococcus baldri TaxID=153730 RepID=A0AA94HMZ4_9MICO|nr:glycosyltransferase [Agrococcus baldri]SFS14046.1 rhamnosyltransferase [Agrococcus baldri]